MSPRDSVPCSLFSYGVHFLLKLNHHAANDIGAWYVLVTFNDTVSLINCRRRLINCRQHQTDRHHLTLHVGSSVVISSTHFADPHRPQPIFSALRKIAKFCAADCNSVSSAVYHKTAQTSRQSQNDNEKFLKSVQWYCYMWISLDT